MTNFTNKIFKTFLALLGVVILSSCASISEGQCRGTNWFERGKSVAMSEKNAFAAKEKRFIDNFKDDCAEFGASYKGAEYIAGHKKGKAMLCTYDFGKSNGRVGRNSKFCSDIAVYIRGEKKGYQSFCTHSKGSEDGAMGAPSNERCLIHLNYKKGFNAGLKSYCTFDNGYDFGEENKTPPYKYCKGAAKVNFRKGLERGKNVHALRAEVANFEKTVEELEDSIQNIDDYEYSQMTPEDAQRKIVENRSQRRKLVRELRKADSRLRSLQRDLER